MISRSEIYEILETYNLKEAMIGVLASHSALDVCDGAVEEGLRTYAVCQKGRDATYTRYFKAQRDTNGKLIRGVVDESLVLDRFNEIILEENQQKLREKNI
ncbi:MAG: DUF1246 domain-containing protein, partial [Candidatus Syntropharchaeales archaeon]